VKLARVLVTERLTLRAWREADFDAYAEMAGHPDVARFLPCGILTRADAWRQMAMAEGHWPLRGFGPYAVTETAGGELVGRVGLWCPEGWPEVELIWTLRRAFWGRGYASEAAARVMDHSFETLPLSKLVSHIDPANLKSQQVARRLGQVFDHKTEIVSNGKVCEVGSWEITRHHWEARRAAA